MDNAKKKHLKKYISWGLIAALVLTLALMPLMAKSDVEEDGPVASIHSGTVQTGSVSTALHGGGTLESEDAEDVKLPSGVKITEFLVKNGDVVTEGTPLATVDKVSVMTAITEVTDTLEYLQEEIESVRDDTVSSTISATAGGRVKKVFAQAGDDVQAVMLENGALALLSLDGLMAVKIERSMDVSTGDSVCVKLSDDTELTGRVESSLDGVIIVTVEDEGYAIGEKVTVTTDDGDRIGTGTLYVHNAWKATAFTGTVSTVYAKEESAVTSGSTLFTLKDTDFTGEMEYLANKHREYEELLQELFQMYQSGAITAPCDGLVSGVDEDSAHLLAASSIDGEAGWYVDLLSNETTGEEKGWTMMLLSNTETVCTGDDNCTAVGNHIDGCPKNVCTLTGACAANADVHQPGCAIISCTMTADCTNAYHKAGCPSVCTGNGDTCQAKSGHLPSCYKSCTKTEDCPATTHLKECIKNCTKTQACTAVNHYNDCPKASYTVYTGYLAKVTEVSTVDNKIKVAMNSNPAQVTETSGGIWNFGTLDVKNPTGLFPYDEYLPVSNAAEYAVGDIVVIALDNTGNLYKIPIAVAASSTTPGQQIPGMGDLGSLGNLSGLLGGMTGNMDMSSMIGGLSGYGNYSGGTTTQTQEEELFDLEGSVLMTVTPQDTVSLTITLDEQDIAKVSVGQTAEVKVEALRGESFEAEVVEVGTSGTNSGGSSKFSVKLRMDMAENMIDGMSATASIPLYTKMEVLTIPVEALVEDGTSTVVYTALDEKTGDPITPVTVEIGISDGETAEVVSGLQSGDTYYYSYYDILELSTDVESSGFSFGK